MNARKLVEGFFAAWSEAIVKHRWFILIFTLGVSLAFATQIRHGWLDVSIESYLPVGDPAIVDYNNFRREFSFAPGAMLVIKTKDGIFNLKNLARLKALHEQLVEELPHSQDVLDLVSVRYSRGEDDSLLIDDLIEVWPKTEAEIPAFKQLVLSNPNYVGTLVSDDGLITTITLELNVYSSTDGISANTETAGNGELDSVIEGFDATGFDSTDTDSTGSAAEAFDTATTNDAGRAESSVNSDGAGQNELAFLTPDEEAEFATAMDSIVAQHSDDDFKIYTVGSTALNHQIALDFEYSTKVTAALGILVIVILLAILFRRLSGIFMPLLVVVLAVTTTLAFWPTLGYAFNGNTQIIPTFILAVGIADAVHILAIFYRYYDQGTSKHDAIIQAMRETSVAVLMTTVTTAAGLLSFLASELIPVKSLGIFGAIGVVMALVYTLTVLPALLAIVPLKRRIPQANTKPNALLHKIDLAIEACGDFGVTHAKSVIAFTTVLMLVAVAGIAQIRIAHDPVRWYNEDSLFRQGFELIDATMDGVMDSQLLIDFGKENSLHDPNVLHAIDEIEQMIEKARYDDTQARAAHSILSVLKETHKSLNNNDPNYYVIPDNKQTIAQELLLFENSGSDDIADFTDTQFRTARINIILPWGDTLGYKGYMREIKSEVAAILKKHQIDDARVIMTGLLAIFGETIGNMLTGTVQSYILAFCLVAVLMVLLMGTIRRGLLAFSPNITPIIVTLGVMGWTDIPLNTFTSLLGCIVIGISVDDTIHFMHHFRRFAQHSDDVRDVVQKTLLTCGRAITFTSIVLIGGFIVNAAGVLTLHKQFAGLLSLAIFIALFANLVLAPALMALFWHNEKAINASAASAGATE